jgi:hypothetical protein
MSKKLTVLLALCALTIAAFAGCSTSSSGDKGKFVGGKWLTRNVDNPAEGFDVVFKDDNTFDGYLPGGSSVKIRGPYEVDGDNNVTGTFTATSGGRVGRIEASLESGGTILLFKFIETNAFDNPGAVNGVITMVCRGPNPTK